MQLVTSIVNPGATVQCFTGVKFPEFLEQKYLVQSYYDPLLESPQL